MALHLRQHQGQRGTPRKVEGHAQGCTQKDPLVCSFLHSSESSSNQFPHCVREKYLAIRWDLPPRNHGVTMMDLYIASYSQYGCKKRDSQHGTKFFRLLKSLRKASVLSINYHGVINSLFDAITGQMHTSISYARSDIPLYKPFNLSGQTFLQATFCTLPPLALGWPAATPSAQPLQHLVAAHPFPFQANPSPPSHPARV